jgi:chromosome segregation ATPase
MTATSSAQNYGNDKKQPTGARLFFRFLTRFLLVLILGFALGVGVIYGLPALSRNLIRPVQQNFDRLVELELEVDQLRDEMRVENRAVNEDWGDLDTRLRALEEATAGIEAQQAELTGNLSEINDTLEEIRSITNRLDALDAEGDKLEARMAVFEAALQTESMPVQEIQRQLQLLRTMELLGRARLWLFQDNLGNAEGDVETARDSLVALVDLIAGDEPESEVESIEKLETIINRLELALEDIRISPDVVEDDLEIAWQLLIEASALTAVEPD